MDYSNKISGSRVREIRKEFGKDMTQKKFAEMLHVSTEYISQLERGRPLPAKLAHKLIDIARKPTSYKWLVGQSDYRTEEEQKLYESVAKIADMEEMNSATATLASLNGYSIFQPDANVLSNYSSIEAFENNQYFVVRLEDMAAIALTRKEVRSFEALVSDFVRIQIEYYFRIKGIFTNSK